MNNSDFLDLLTQWTIDEEYAPSGPEGLKINYLRLQDLINFTAEKAYSDYSPTTGPHPSFDMRLRNWLSNIEDPLEKKIFLRFVPQLLFFTREHFDSLFRSAFNGPFCRCALETVALDRFYTEDLDAIIKRETKRTWLCAITDSMDISRFCHANGLEGRNYRPDWLSLEKFGQTEKLLQFIATESIERIMLLEDFVGSGSQMHRVISYCCRLSESIQILATPLICCPEGLRLGETLAREFPNLLFEPTLQLQPKSFLTPRTVEDEPQIFSLLRPIIQACHSRVVGSATPNFSKKPYGPHGYRETGATVVLNSNTPDNTLPIVHHESQSWNPLFPRSSRI